VPAFAGYLVTKLYAPQVVPVRTGPDMDCDSNGYAVYDRSGGDYFVVPQQQILDLLLALAPEDRVVVKRRIKYWHDMYIVDDEYCSDTDETEEDTTDEDATNLRDEGKPVLTFFPDAYPRESYAANKHQQRSTPSSDLLLVDWYTRVPYQEITTTLGVTPANGLCWSVAPLPRRC
jgi:hypothetical protein